MSERETLDLDAIEARAGAVELNADERYALHEIVGGQIMGAVTNCVWAWVRVNRSETLEAEDAANEEYNKRHDRLMLILAKKITARTAAR